MLTDRLIPPRQTDISYSRDVEIRSDLEPKIKIHLGSAMAIQIENRRASAMALPGFILGALAVCASAGAATSGPLVGAGGFPVLKEIVVTGTKEAENAADAALNVRQSNNASLVRQ